MATTSLAQRQQARALGGRPSRQTALAQPPRLSRGLASPSSGGTLPAAAVVVSTAAAPPAIRPAPRARQLVSLQTPFRAGGGRI